MNESKHDLAPYGVALSFFTMGYLLGSLSAIGFSSDMEKLTLGLIVLYILIAAITFLVYLAAEKHILIFLKEKGLKGMLGWIWLTFFFMCMPPLFDLMNQHQMSFQRYWKSFIIIIALLAFIVLLCRRNKQRTRTY